MEWNDSCRCQLLTTEAGSHQFLGSMTSLQNNRQKGCRVRVGLRLRICYALTQTICRCRVFLTAFETSQLLLQLGHRAHMRPINGPKSLVNDPTPDRASLRMKKGKKKKGKNLRDYPRSGIRGDGKQIGKREVDCFGTDAGVRPGCPFFSGTAYSFSSTRARLETAGVDVPYRN